MATGKRYYWIKLKESFMTSDTVDFLMSLPDGANYVVFYQMLSLKTINTGGKLYRKIGEIYVPYDAEKICRDFKWFSKKIVRDALDLFLKIGLLQRDANGAISLVGYENLVGSETDYAEQKKRQRNELVKNEISVPDVDNVHTDDHTKCGHDVDKGVDIVHTDIDIRDRERDRYRESERAPAYTREENAPAGTAYGKYANVVLTDEEYRSLSSDYPDLASKIDRLSAYMMQTGKTYSNHAAVIREWAFEDAKKAAKGKNVGTGTDAGNDEFWRTAVKASYGETMGNVCLQMMDRHHDGKERNQK